MKTLVVALLIASSGGNPPPPTPPPPNGCPQGTIDVGGVCIPVGCSAVGLVSPALWALALLIARRRR